MNTVQGTCLPQADTQPPQAANVFATQRLQLAIFLHATKCLLFRKCVGVSEGRISFLFEDPQNEGAQVELEFDRGAPVPATDLFSSQKYLRRRMSEALEKRRIEKSNGNLSNCSR